MEILFSSSESESDTTDDSSTSSSDLSVSEDCDYEENVFIKTCKQYSDEDFKAHFRMTRATISYLTGNVLY